MLPVQLVPVSRDFTIWRFVCFLDADSVLLGMVAYTYNLSPWEINGSRPEAGGATATALNLWVTTSLGVPMSFSQESPETMRKHIMIDNRSTVTVMK